MMAKKLKSFSVTGLFYASKTVTVQATTKKEAEEKAINDVSYASICHQ